MTNEHRTLLRRLIECWKENREQDMADAVRDADDWLNAPTVSMSSNEGEGVTGATPVPTTNPKEDIVNRLRDCWGRLDPTEPVDQVTLLQASALLAEAAHELEERQMIDTQPPTEHIHTNECWEPDSGCDMGRNEKYVRASSGESPRERLQWMRQAREALGIEAQPSETPEKGPHIDGQHPCAYPSCTALIGRAIYCSEHEWIEVAGKRGVYKPSWFCPMCHTGQRERPAVKTPIMRGPEGPHCPTCECGMEAVKAFDKASGSHLDGSALIVRFRSREDAMAAQESIFEGAPTVNAEEAHGCPHMGCERPWPHTHEITGPHQSQKAPASQLTGIDFLQTWMRTPNPMLGGTAPLEMMKLGHGDKLAQFIDNAYEASQPPETQANKEGRECVVKMATERNEFVTDVDGYVYWGADGSPHGYFASHHLRWLADELDRKNEPWDTIIQNDPRIGAPEVSSND